MKNKNNKTIINERFQSNKKGERHICPDNPRMHLANHFITKITRKTTIYRL